MSARDFLDGKVRLHDGDCLDVLRGLADASVDSVVTDPPYALVSIVKRFGGKDAKPTKDGDVYARASAGFMGKAWDTGERAFAVEFWREVWRVLKPGGHVAAFSGTRTYHRLAVAIEDAGFEIRDQLAWAYGSGFPKSHDVSKGIDKHGGNSHLTAEIGSAIKAARLARGVSIRDADARYCGGSTLWTWYEGRPAGQQMPTASVMAAIAADWPELARYTALIAAAEREVVGVSAASRLAVAPGQDNDRSATTLDITAPATDAARQWEGWGTALKPAWEPICLARKPLGGTVAANVLEHGTGALNIDGCRIEAPEGLTSGGNKQSSPLHMDRAGEINRVAERSEGHALGRWPANLLHDGSAEVVACFPQSESTPFRANDPGTLLHGGGIRSRSAGGFADSGSAARFFASFPNNGAPGSAAPRLYYTSKADADDRLGSKHPTVKPVDLMQWLCRLITPPGGLILDPFAGTGTTGEAAFREGFRAVLIEREAEYQADIAKRMSLVLAGPDERKRARTKAEAPDALPLFGGAA